MVDTRGSTHVQARPYRRPARSPPRAKPPTRNGKHVPSPAVTATTHTYAHAVSVPKGDEPSAFWPLLLFVVFMYCAYTVVNSHTMGVKAASAGARAPPTTQPWQWRPLGRLPEWFD